MSGSDVKRGVLHLNVRRQPARCNTSGRGIGKKKKGKLKTGFAVWGHSATAQGTGASGQSLPRDKRTTSCDTGSGSGNENVFRVQGRRRLLLTRVTSCFDAAGRHWPSEKRSLGHWKGGAKRIWQVADIALAPNCYCWERSGLLEGNAGSKAVHGSNQKNQTRGSGRKIVRGTSVELFIDGEAGRRAYHPRIRGHVGGAWGRT